MGRCFQQGGRARTAKKDRALVAAAALGFLTTVVLDTMTTQVPSLHRLLGNPLADILVILVALATTTALAVWAWQPEHRDRMASMAAIMAAGLLVVLANVVAPAMGWWGGTYFQKGPLLILAVLTGVGAMGGFALVVLGYHWLAARTPKLARLVLGLFLLVLFPAAVGIGDQFALRAGMMTFGGGYTVGHDVVVAEVFFLAPVLLYEGLRRRLGVPRASRAEAGRHP
jgi:hypothetical protein